MAAQIGTLSQKIDRQPMVETSTPPTTGPQAVATPKIPDQMPMAWARSLGSWNVLRTIDSETGVSIDPPMPCSMRSAISQPVSGASEQSSEPRPNPARPTRKTRLRPSRSAAEPVSSSSDATTSR